MTLKKATKKGAKKPTKKATNKPSRKAAKKTPKQGASSKAPAKKKSAPPQPRAPRPAKPVLRQVPLYEFTAGNLCGYVRTTDPGRGVEFCRTREGPLLPAFSQEVLSLRHYLSRGEGGLLVPRQQAPCTGKVEKNGVVFRYDKTPKWPLTATAQYDLLPAGGIDATFSFRFGKTLRGFEAAVETIMPRKQLTGYYVHCDGRWAKVATGARLQLFYPRNLGAAEMIADGRWSRLRMGGTGLAIEPQGYDYPILVVREEKSAWALIYMALTEDCSTLWVNGADRTVGLGLIGADAKAQSSITCRVRVLLRQVQELSDVLPCYREFVQEARATRRR